jgi:hypothetical protein
VTAPFFAAASPPRRAPSARDRHAPALFSPSSPPALPERPTAAPTPAPPCHRHQHPEGPRVDRGLRRGYEVSPASGLPSLSYPLEVPPGRAGLAPELALHYHAGGGAGVLGLGWSLDLPAIERSLRAGIPRADGPAVLDS